MTKLILECSNLTKSFQGIDLLKDITFKIDDKDKAALIGVNGAGKTTVLSLIIGELNYDSGDIFKSKDLTIGYLRQQHQLDLDKTVYQTALDIFKPLIEMEQRLRDLEHKMADDHSPEIMNEYDRLQNEFSTRQGYEYPSRIQGVLKGLGFQENDLNLKVGSLSGGQKTRLALGELLLKQPRLLILDEPTNHLDHDATVFLENFLKNYPHAILVVSHDRYFIDQIATKIVEIENGRTKSYPGSYSAYATIKKQNRNIELNHYINQQREIKKMQQSIDTLKSFNREKSVKRARSKEKQLEKIELVERPESLPDSIRLSFQAKVESGYDVLKVSNLAMSFSGPLFQNINFDIKKQERICLVGANGIGKTTLLKIITQQLRPSHGKIKPGSKVEMAYYDQEHSSLNFGNTIFQEISDAYPKMTNTEIRSTLALFNFRNDDVFKEIGLLSGGEKGRVLLAKILLKQANFLILDEPTNHLDIASKEILEDALADYDGTIIFISHDRFFINKLATKIIELTPDKVIEIPGNYEHYLTVKTNYSQTKEKDNSDYIQHKQSQAKVRQHQKQIRTVENKISQLEDKIGELNSLLVSQEVVDDYQKYNEVNEQILALESELETSLNLWEDLQI